MRRGIVSILVMAGIGGVPGLAAQERTEEPAREAAPVVVGRVVDESGAGLARAQVVVVGSGRLAEADAAGRFVLRGLPVGRHQLRVSLIGYAPVTRVVEVFSGGGSGAGSGGWSSELVIALASTPLSLPGIQVTGTAVGRDPLAITQSTAQLSGKQLERELSTTVAETLRSQPGLSVRYNGPAAAAPVVRGLTGDRILVLQDGQRTADLSGSADDHGVTIDPLSAQRIEVVRGPATLLYGNNALGGVVNVISGDLPATLPSRGAWVLGLQTESAYPGISGSVRSTLPLGGRWVLNARAGGKTAGDVRIGDDPVLGDRLENTSQRAFDGALGLGYIGDEMVVAGTAKLYDFQYGLPIPPGTAPVELRGRRHEGSGRAEWALSSPLFPLLRVEGTAQEYGHDEIDLHSGQVLQAFALETRTVNLTLRQGRIGPLTEGAWGVSGLFKDYAATGPAALTPAAVSRSLGFFGYQELAFGDAGPALQLGGRYDHYRIGSRASAIFVEARSNVYRALSGSVGFRVPLAEGLSLGASYARSFRAPTVEELFSGAYHAGTGTVEYGDPDLLDERGRGLEGLLQVRTGRLNGQIALYRNAIEHYIHMAARGDTVIDGATVEVIEYVQDRATLTGVEGSLEWAVGKELALMVMGDLIRAELRDATPLSFMPPARLGGELRWDNGTFSLSGVVHHEFRQGRVGPADEVPTDAHTILRLSAGVRRQLSGVTHSLALRAENLTNRLHRESTSRIKEFAPNPGRNVSVVYRLYF